RVQHALRAFTPRDQKAVRSAAATLRANPRIDTAEAITELSVGEALISLLDENGRPAMVERAFILPPASRIGPISDAERSAIIASSRLRNRYEQAIDRESAYEIINNGASTGNEAGRKVASRSTGRTDNGSQEDLKHVLSEVLLGKTGPRGGHQPGILDSVAKSAARSIGSQVGREIFRGVLGSIFGGSRRR
ncbi:MAG TPA: helicase HerA-like domain-containing protein, partial [Nitrosospira sp.]|nr:helicase HerA-like domain-containing protein [Nitrosospira sp.]